MRKRTLKERCMLLGYRLDLNQKDNMGVRHEFLATPRYIEGWGLWHYFDSEEQVEKWIERVIEVRSYQNDGISLAELMK